MGGKIIKFNANLLFKANYSNKFRDLLINQLK